MRNAWPAEFHRALAGRIEDELGLHMPEHGQGKRLRRGITAAAASLGSGDDELARRIVEREATPVEWSALAEALAVGETYFFRDTDCFGYLASVVLPALFESKRTASRSVRIWSVGCSSGEEPYSIAMLLASLRPDWREWDIRILATDLRADALAKARVGEYGAWSLRGGIPADVRGFLRRVGKGRHEVDASIRDMVRFEPLNLARDDYPSANTGTLGVDLIICRNVLMYFRQDRVRAIAERLGRCLGEGGWLLTNAIEVPGGGMPGLQPVRGSDTTAFRRITTAPVAVAPIASSHRGIERTTASFRATPKTQAVTRHRPVHRPAVHRPEDAAPSSRAQDISGRARELANAGELAAAASACKAAIDQDKLNPAWTYLLASILQECEEFAQAEVALRRTLYLEPGHVLARIAMANLMMRQGGASRARQHFAVALDRLACIPGEEVLPYGGGLTARELVAAIRGHQERVA